MNILEQTEALKDLPDQALIKEMKMPTGMAPPVFITAELKRRQRIRDDFKRREAADTPTVAEEVVMAAGMPQGGIADAARALAPKTDMGQNTGVASMMPRTATRAPQPMAEGGIVRLQEGGDVEEVERYMVVISGINNSRPMTLSADTLEQLQNISPEVMATAVVVDAETAKERGVDITKLRPGDGFVVREVAERLPPERRGAVTTDVATLNPQSTMVDQPPAAPSMISSSAAPQLLEGGVASLGPQGKQEQTVNMDPYLQTPSISTVAPDNPNKKFDPTFSQFNAPYRGMPVINMAPTQIDPRSGLERYEAELEADPDNMVASVARLGQAGKNAAEIANMLGRPIQEIIDIGLGIAADGTVGVGALAADLIAVVQGAVVNNPESAEFYANIAKNLRKFGDDSYYAEGEILPRIFNTTLLQGEDSEKAAEEKRKQIQSDSLRAISDAMLANDQSLFAEGAPAEFLPEGQVYTVPRNVPVTSVEGTLGSPEVNPDNLATPNLTSLSGDAIKTISTPNEMQIAEIESRGALASSLPPEVQANIPYDPLERTLADMAGLKDRTYFMPELSTSPASELVDTEYLDTYRRELIEGRDGDPIVPSITEGGKAAALGEPTQAQQENFDNTAAESSIDVAQAQADAETAKINKYLDEASKVPPISEIMEEMADAEAQAESIRPEEFALRPKARPASFTPAEMPADPTPTDLISSGIASTSSDAINAAVKQSGGLSTDAWLAIAQGGAAMAASRSPTLIGALGEGIGAAAKGLQAQRKTEKAAALEQAKIDATLEAARMRSAKTGQATVSQKLKILDDQIMARQNQLLAPDITNIKEKEIRGQIEFLQMQKNNIAAEAGIMLSSVGGAPASNMEDLGQA